MFQHLDVWYDSTVSIDLEAWIVQKRYHSTISLDQLREYHELQSKIAKLINSIGINCDVTTSAWEFFHNAILRILPLQLSSIQANSGWKSPVSLIEYIPWESSENFHLPVSTLLNDWIDKGLEPKVAWFIENNFHWKNVRLQRHETRFVITDIGWNIKKLLWMRERFWL